MPALIALVGRPNVGKSALFNCIGKRSQAIVESQEGVTRDRQYGRATLFDRSFDIVDTGGMLSSDPLFGQEVTRQAMVAVQEADGMILVVDGRAGLQPLDIEIARIVRKTNKPFCLAVNKIDHRNALDFQYLFSSLGIEPMVAVSAAHRFQIVELLQAIVPRVEDCSREIKSSIYPKVAIIGRSNVGKSLLYNTIIGSERSIVSDAIGTTRDSIDTDICYDGQHYTLIDTAGIRKKHKERCVVEKFASIRTKRAIERSDLCLLVVDAQQGVTAEEKKIAKAIEEAGKGCVLLLNKWDLVHNIRMEHALRGVEEEIAFLSYSPKVCISAKTGRNIPQAFLAVRSVLDSLATRVPTHQLNTQLLTWMEKYHPPMIKGRRLRIYYMTQAETKPPKFVLFVNNPVLMGSGYRRYLVNRIRSYYGLYGVPFTLWLKGKKNTHKRNLNVLDRDLGIVSQLVNEEQGVLAAPIDHLD